MKSIISNITPSASSYIASAPMGSTPQPKSHYNGRQAFCPGVGWMAWGYVALLRDLKASDLPQA